MTEEQEQVWEILNTSSEELRRQFIIAEFNRMIEEKLIKLVDKEADAAIYSAMVKSYYKADNDDIYDGSRILDYIKNSA